jgi:hypothetical protein
MQHRRAIVLETMKPSPRLLSTWGLVIGLLMPWAGLAQAANDFSPAEQALFMDNHLGKLDPPLTLHYGYRKAGTLEEGFDDKVEVILAAQADGSCCSASARFLTGAHAVRQPEVDHVQGNPAILYFLERDVREMQRLTKGQPNHFRKRIRMAIYNGAAVRELTLPYRGRPVAVREISIAPYLDDPNRARFEKLAGKRYVFMLSEAVPGKLYGIRAQVDGPSADAPPLIIEEMLVDGAVAARRQP